MSGILRLESLTKGNTLKQGDKTPLKYKLFDADGDKLNIAGKSAKVRLVYPDFLTIGYEKDGLTVAQDDTVTFTIDKIIPAKLYHVEIIVDDKFIFPSRADESKFTVDKSSLGTETNIIEIVGVDAVVRKAVDLINADPNLIIDEDKLVGDIISNTGIGSIEEYYQQFNDVIKELSKDKDYYSLPEIAGARGGHDTLGQRLDETTAQLAQKADLQKADLIVPVGENGMFQTINEAIEFLSTKKVKYNKGGFKAEIVLLTGFKMREQVLVDGLDLGYITIRSENNQTVIIRREYLTTQLKVDGMAYLGQEVPCTPAFGGVRNAVLPVIDVLFRMDDTGAFAGSIAFFVGDNSRLHVRPNRGCTHAHTGIYAINGAYVTSYEGIYNHSKTNAVVAFRGSFVSIRRGKGINCLGDALYLGSSSYVEALEADFSGAGKRGAWVYGGGRLNIRDGALADCGQEAIYAHHGAMVSAGRTNLNRSRVGIRATTGSIVEAHEATIRNTVLQGIEAMGKSIVNAEKAELINNGLYAIYAERGSDVNADSSTINGCQENTTAVMATNGSRINLNNALINDNVGSGVYANRGSEINVDSADCSGNSGISDIRIARGSIINANESTGRLSHTANELSANGIIFK